ncbi:MAG: hypothetical protein WAO20_21750 [Acidobacteriota bacterium]
MRLLSRESLTGALIALSLIIPALWGQSSDPYSLNLVKGVLQHYGHVSTGWEDKGLPRLGDKGAIALIKLSSLDSWKERDHVRTALGIIRDSFSHPELIEDPSDKRPSVTLLLLAWLKSIHQRNPETLGDIEQTEQFIERQTRSQ